MLKIFINKSKMISEAYKEMESIEGYKAKRITTPQDSLREKYKILVIDDEGFDVNQFRSRGFIRLHRKDDISDITDVDSFDIILCDIEGVGTDWDMSTQGAGLAMSIKTRYSDKYVSLYSNKITIEELEEQTIYTGVLEAVDGYIAKSASNSGIERELDRIIEKMENPISRWVEDIRPKLIKNGTGLKTIVFFEHFLIKSIEDNVNYFDTEIFTPNNGLKEYLPIIGMLSKIVLAVI